MENYGLGSEKTLRWITVITLPQLPTFSVATANNTCHFRQSGSKTNRNSSENRESTFETLLLKYQYGTSYKVKKSLYR